MTTDKPPPPWALALLSSTRRPLEATQSPTYLSALPPSSQVYDCRGKPREEKDLDLLPHPQAHSHRANTPCCHIQMQLPGASPINTPTPTTPTPTYLLYSDDQFTVVTASSAKDPNEKQNHKTVAPSSFRFLLHSLKGVCFPYYQLRPRTHPQTQEGPSQLQTTALLSQPPWQHGTSSH